MPEIESRFRLIWREPRDVFKDARRQITCRRGVKNQRHILPCADAGQVLNSFQWYLKLSQNHAGTSQDRDVCINILGSDLRIGAGRENDAVVSFARDDNHSDAGSAVACGHAADLNTGLLKMSPELST